MGTPATQIPTAAAAATAIAAPICTVCHTKAVPNEAGSKRIADWARPCLCERSVSMGWSAAQYIVFDEGARLSHGEEDAVGPVACHWMMLREGVCRPMLGLWDESSWAMSAMFSARL